MNTPNQAPADALADIESACINSPHRAAGTWDENLAKLIHHHARHIAALASQPAQAGVERWRDHVEQRLLSWRQRFVNKSGDQLALDDFMDKQSLDDLIDYVCNEYAAPTPPQAQPAPAIDVDAMLRACVPCGGSCDPQHVADAIREWFKQPAPVAVDERGFCDQVHAQFQTEFKLYPGDERNRSTWFMAGAMYARSALQSSRSGQPAAVPASQAVVLGDARDALQALLTNIRSNAPQLSGKSMGFAEQVIVRIDAALAHPPAAPDHVPDARKMVEAPALVPLSDTAVFASDGIMAVNAELGLPMAKLMKLARAIERAHGIGLTVGGDGGEHG